jgi:hypothetical protein
MMLALQMDHYLLLPIDIVPNFTFEFVPQIRYKSQSLKKGAMKLQAINTSMAEVSREAKKLGAMILY